jgi:hypothetical protein
VKHDKAQAPQSGELTDQEAITLRRVAFGESEVRVLPRSDIDRLVLLRLIAADGTGMVLTNSGRARFDSLPRAMFAMKLIR